MKLVGFYNEDGVYPNLLSPVFEMDKHPFIQQINDTEIRYCPFEKSSSSQDYFSSHSYKEYDEDQAYYAFSTLNRNILFGDKEYIQQVAKHNLFFLSSNLPVQAKIYGFLEEYEEVDKINKEIERQRLLAELESLEENIDDGYPPPT